jgi:rhamnose transport system substrate-binding protein
MRRHKLSVLTGLVAVAALASALLAGVGSARSDNKSTPAAAGAAAKSYKIFLIPKFIGIPVFTLNGQGGKEAAKKLGDTVTYNGPTEASAAKQVPFIDTAVRQGYNAIVISANDPNAVAPALKRAQARGLKVVSYDADAAKDARTVYVSPPSTPAIGAGLVEWVGSQMGYKGQLAILSATTTAANQNAWIAVIKQTLKKSKYKGMQLVKIAYGNDQDTKSAQETQALLQAYPNLKGIIAPTSVGLPAAARVLQQAKKCGSIALTGLATPNSMRAYTKRGCGKKFGLWNEVDFGYLAVYVAHAVLDGKLTGKAGQSLVAGRLGKRTIGANNTMPMGPPLVFTRKNIDKYRF